MYRLVHVLSSIDSFFYRKKNGNYLLTELSQTNYAIFGCSHMFISISFVSYDILIPSRSVCFSDFKQTSDEVLLFCGIMCSLYLFV